MLLFADVETTTLNRSLMERFHSKYIKNLETGCWEWNAYKDRDGYGVFQLNQYPKQAHRVSWLFSNGEIPPNTLVCHKCDNPGCVNPEHLFLGTNSDNMQDMLSKNRSNYSRGEYVGTSKLEEAQVRYIKSNKQYTGKDLAEEFGVSPALISMIRSNKCWKHVQV